MSAKTHYSVKELASMELDSLPASPINIRNKAKKENWSVRDREGRGGGVEYAFESLPAEVQKEIAEKQALAIAEEVAPAREIRAISRASFVAARDISRLSDKQRQIADARMVVVEYIRELEAVRPRNAAVRLFSEQAKAGQLPEAIKTWLGKAMAKPRKNGVSERTLAGWMADADKCDTAAERLAHFAPKKMGKKFKTAKEYPWMADFLMSYQQFTGRPLAEAYREFVRVWQAKHPEAAVPCLTVVRNAAKKLPKFVLERGRLTGARMKALKTYRKRDWSVLKNNDVWVGDGHSLKMKVAHPDHGNPFTPELTLIMDSASRYIVGWSLAYSENTFAVADALRHGMTQHGIPAIYYSDNGGGQKNHVLDNDLMGVFTRLGVHHETGIPGSPQGRGIIERVMKTLAHPIARQFATYHGPNADPDTVRRVSTATASLAKAQSEGRQQLTVKQNWAKGKLPSWNQLLDAVEDSIKEYNESHIHSEIGMTPAQKRQQIFDRMTAEEFFPLTEIEARELFRPAFKRTVERAWLRLFNNYYWHKDLEALDGAEVMLLVDQHDPSTVIVKDLAGNWICDAVLNGNQQAAFGESLVERSKRGRAEAKLKRLRNEAEKAIAELRPAIEAQAHQSLAEIVSQDFLVGGATAEVEEAEEADFWQDIKHG